MIVVIGNPVAVATETGHSLAGVPARAAAAAARAGATVQLVGKAGEDRAGDDLMLALATAGVGHVALLRDPARATPVRAPVVDEPDALAAEDDEPTPDPAPADGPTLEPADVELALRYLQDYATIVVAEPQPASVVTVVSEAASWVGATVLIVVDGNGQEIGAPESALVFAAPPHDPDGAFATMLGELAAAIDAGTPPESAFRAVEGRLGLTPVADPAVE